MKEAKDELRRVKAERLAAQCAAARKLLEEQPFPRRVVLNLAAGGDGGGGDGKGRGDGKAVLLPALLVGQVEPPQEATVAVAGKELPPLPFYACLAADNRLMRVSVSCVVGVLAGPDGIGSPEDLDKVLAAVQGVRANAWRNIEGEPLGVGRGRARMHWRQPTACRCPCSKYACICLCWIVSLKLCEGEDTGLACRTARSKRGERARGIGSAQ